MRKSDSRHTAGDTNNDPGQVFAMLLHEREQLQQQIVAFLKSQNTQTGECHARALIRLPYLRRRLAPSLKRLGSRSDGILSLRQPHFRDCSKFFICGRI